MIFIAISIILVITTFKYAVLANWNSFLFIVEKLSKHCCSLHHFRNPYEERTAHAYHVYSGTGHGSWGYSGMVT